MIDFRYHLVSIVAVFLALAIGIVLGSTELQGPTYNLLNQTTAKLQNELDQASSQRDTAQQQANLGENYAQAVQPVVLHNLLAGQRLLIVTEPGAPASVVTAISNAATQDAGATVTGQIALQSKFFDNSDTTLDGLNQINLAMSAGRQHRAEHRHDLPAAGRAGDRQRDPHPGGGRPARPASSRSPARRRAASRTPTRRPCSGRTRMRGS